MKMLRFGKNDERWGLFLVKRAKPFVAPASLLEIDLFADDIDDVQTIFDLLDAVGRHRS